MYFQKDSPSWQILEHLQRNGSSTIKELEQMLGVTTTAVRQHLGMLQSKGHIERRSVKTGLGRPHHAYFITEKARELFACHCDDLALTLLEEVFDLAGSEATVQLLQRVGSRLAGKYTESVRSEVLQERVEELATAFNSQGILADVSSDEESITLTTYNCPFHELAHEHTEVCEMDQDMVKNLLHSEVDMDSRITEGHNCCSFVVKRKSTTAPEEREPGKRNAAHE